MTNYDLIPFGSEITGDDGITEVRVTKDSLQGCKRISARDIISVVCKKDRNQAAEVWRNVVSEGKVIGKVNHFTLVLEFQFSGRGQHKQPVLSLKEAFQLLMVLPGERAKQFRTSTAQLLLKYFAGDESLVNEIRANAQFGGLLNEMAREELQAEQVAPASAVSFEEDCRRRLEVVKIMKIEDSATLRRLKVQEKSVDSDLKVMTRKFEHENDLLDKESLCKRRRIEDESRAKEISIIHLKLADIGDSVQQLATTLRGLNFPEDTVSSEIAKHVMYLKTRAAVLEPAPALPAVPAQPVSVPAPPVAAPVPPGGGEFTARSFVAQHQLFRGIPAYKHDTLLRKIGTKLIEKCREQGIILGPQVHEGAYLVHSYSPAATALARSIAEEIARQELAGPTQRDIRASFGSVGSAGSGVPA